LVQFQLRPQKDETRRRGEEETRRHRRASPRLPVTASMSPRRILIGPVAQSESEHLSSKQNCAGSSPARSAIQCGVAQTGKSVRLINERVRVRIPPPRPNSRPGETETRGHGDTETRRHGDAEKEREWGWNDAERCFRPVTASPRLPLSASFPRGYDLTA
jgi:hypothetical protein